MKKTILILAIAFLVTALVLSGCGKTATTQATQTTAQQSAPKEMSCTDTDSGNLKQTKGQVSGVDVNGKEYTFKDTCYEGQIIVEYFCDGKEYKNQNYFCDCENGACSE